MNQSEIIAFLKQGMSYSDIAKVYGISRQCVHQYATRYKLTKYRTEYITNQKELIHSAKWHSKFRKWGTLYLTDRPLWLLLRKKYTAKKQDAKRRGYDFSLTFGEIVWPSHCPVLGIELDYYGPHSSATPTFDRIDNTKGYIDGNVWIISQQANSSKYNKTRESHPEYFEMIGL